MPSPPLTSERILHIQKAAGIGGSERHLLSLLPGLQDRGLSVGMCVMVEADGDRFVRALRSAGVETFRVSAGPDLNPILIARLVRLLRRFGATLVHTHLIHADLHGQIAARIAAIPAVSSAHSTMAFYRRAPYRGTARFAWRLARRVIAISQHTKRFLVEANLVREERISVIPYGIDGREWLAADREREAARAQLGLRSDEFVVGIAARLIPLKGHEILCEAAAAIAGRVPHLRVLIAGDGPLRPWLEQRIRRENQGAKVQLIGFVDDVRAFMGACDAIVFPTLAELGEGFGLAALEAMAAGRPVIATAVGALPELVVDGETGILVPPGDVRGLAEAFCRLAGDRDLGRRIGRAGRERYERLFSAERMTSQTLEVYEQARDT